jgi:predicted small lipoprotein YifL
MLPVAMGTRRPAPSYNVTMRALVVLMLILPSLLGCGLKGSLYLPPEPAPPPPAETLPAAQPTGTDPATDEATDKATAEDAADRGERRQVPPAPDRDQAR